MAVRCLPIPHSSGAFVYVSVYDSFSLLEAKEEGGSWLLSVFVILQRPGQSTSIGVSLAVCTHAVLSSTCGNCQTYLWMRNWLHAELIEGAVQLCSIYFCWLLCADAPVITGEPPCIHSHCSRSLGHSCGICWTCLMS